MFAKQQAGHTAPWSDIPDTQLEVSRPCLTKQSLKGSTFVLVHGSWHGGWAWDGVAPILQAQGATVFSPTLPGHGGPPEDSQKYLGHVPEPATLTLDDCVQYLRAFITINDLHGVILVGHSFGCMVATNAAPLVAERLRAFVMVAGHMPKAGESLNSMVPPHLRTMFVQAAMENDGCMPLPWEIFRGAFCNEGPDADAQALYDRLRPEPLQPGEDASGGPDGLRALPIPKHAILFNQDITIPPPHYTMSAERIPEIKVHRMDGSHEAIVTRPEEVAGLLMLAAV